MDTKGIANEKVNKAIQLVNQASELLSLACGELCTIVGAHDEWNKLGDHMDATKELAKQINFTIDRTEIDLDSDEKRKFQCNIR